MFPAPVISFPLTLKGVSFLAQPLLVALGLRSTFASDERCVEYTEEGSHPSEGSIDIPDSTWYQRPSVVALGAGMPRPSPTEGTISKKFLLCDWKSFPTTFPGKKGSRVFNLLIVLPTPGNRVLFQLFAAFCFFSFVLHWISVFLSFLSAYSSFHTTNVPRVQRDYYTVTFGNSSDSKMIISDCSDSL